jgi:NADH-quinone oxidoreductase subunit N
MNVTQLLDQFLQQDLARSLQIFLPELILSFTIVLLLLSRLLGLSKAIPGCWIALIGTLVAFVAVWMQFSYLKNPDGGWLWNSLVGLFHLTPAGVGTEGTYFTGLLVHDPFAVFFRLGLLLFLVLMISLTVLTGIPDLEDGPDFYTLLLGATLGMLMATGVNHLLMLFLSIEMMSVPSYAMVGFLKGNRKSSEAALKYVIYGAGTAGVMLYGLSLLAGLFGTADFGLFAERFTTVMAGQPFSLTSGAAIVTLLGILMLFVGIAFKLSLFPFHFWCPDAFEGAPAEVAGFLSIASKAAVFALLLRFVTSFTGEDPVVRQLATYLGLGLGVVAAFSMTLGNLAAFAQTNIKRLLAYSTIAHAGYIVMAVAAMMVISNSAAGEIGGSWNPFDESLIAVEGLVYYLAVYLFMNLTAFAVVAFIRNETYREDIDSYNGLISEGPWTKILCVALLFSFISLVGIPPFGGFLAKLMIFRSVLVAGELHPLMWGVLAVAGINTVISLFYYMRVLRAVFMLPADPSRREVRTQGVVAAYIGLVSLPILLLGVMSVLQARLSETARAIAVSLFT